MKSYHSALEAPDHLQEPLSTIDARDLSSVDEDEIDKMFEQDGLSLAANLVFSPLRSNASIAFSPSSPSSDGESYCKQNSLASCENNPIGKQTSRQIVRVVAFTNSAHSYELPVTSPPSFETNALCEEVAIDAGSNFHKCIPVDVTTDGSPTITRNSAPPVLVTYGFEHLTLFAPLLPSSLVFHTPLLAGHDALYRAPLSDLMQALCSEITTGDNGTEVVLQWPEMGLEITQGSVEAGRVSMEEVARVYEGLISERPMSLVVRVREKVGAKIKRLWGLVEECCMDWGLNSSGSEDECSQQVGEWTTAQEISLTAEQKVVRSGKDSLLFRH